jgi:hypothetical protein
MVGTTRPRISVFMQRFRNLGLIETNADHFPDHQRKEAHGLPRSDRLARWRMFAGLAITLFKHVHY